MLVLHSLQNLLSILELVILKISAIACIDPKCFNVRIQASLKKSMDITQNNQMINLGFAQEKQLSAHAKMCEN